MRILVLHSRYLSGSASGENRVVDDEVRLLREAGHEVDLWSPAPEAGGLRLARTGMGAVWSPAAAREVRTRVRRRGVEVVHCHNLFPMLSPAVIPAAADEGAAVVATLHNYRLLCLAGTFRRAGHDCRVCLGRAPWRGVVHRCYRGSLPASGAIGLAVGLARARRTLDRVDLFLPVSRFVRDVYLEAGFAPDRLRVKTNFAWPAPLREGVGRHYLYVGRLSPEKGVANLLEAWRTRTERLLIVGDGPEADTLRSAAPPEVEFAGAVAADEVPALIAKARALLVPSRWPEASGRVVIEAAAAGVPAVTSAVGGLPELVADGTSGLLVRDGPDEWRRALDALADDGEVLRLGEGARQLWSERFAPEPALTSLTEAYEAALARCRPAAAPAPPEPALLP